MQRRWMGLVGGRGTVEATPRPMQSSRAAGRVPEWRGSAAAWLENHDWSSGRKNSGCPPHTCPGSTSGQTAMPDTSASGILPWHRSVLSNSSPNGQFSQHASSFTRRFITAPPTAMPPTDGQIPSTPTPTGRSLLRQPTGTQDTRTHRGCHHSARASTAPPA
jgi:hypothetical protein